MNQLIRYIFYDLLRTRFVIAYTIFLTLATAMLFQLDTDSSKVTLSLLNIVLMVVPLVSIVFTTIHFYNSHEFIELMLVQPVNRTFIFLSEFLAVAVSLNLACCVGIGIPAVLFGADPSVVTLLLVAVFLTTVFVSLAFCASALTRDKAKAIGVALLFWFYFSLIYDGLLLWIVYGFNDYPLEKITLGLIALNPVDLARIIMLLQLDISALMGYTGAFYKEIFGTGLGTSLSILALLLWICIPLMIGLRIFSRKDL
jgi:Cu-processing system permease protein